MTSVITKKNFQPTLDKSISREEAKIAFEVIHKENKDALSKIWTDKQVEIIKIHRFLEMRWHLKRGEIRGKDKEGKGDRGG